MSGRWQSGRSFAVVLAAWVAGPLLLYLAVHLPLSGPVSALNDPAAGVTAAELERHYPLGAETPDGSSDFGQVQEAMGAERAALDNALATARRQIEFRPGAQFTIGADVPERPLKYAHERDRIIAKLRELANKDDVKIPEALDPRRAKGELKNKEIDSLLYRLAMTDRAVRAAVAAHVGRVVSIKHTYRPPEGVPLAHRRVTVKLEAELGRLIEFIENCSTPPGGSDDAGGGILSVRGATLAARPDGTLRAEVTLAAITYIQVQPRVVKPPPAARPGLETGPSY